MGEPGRGGAPFHPGQGMVNQPATSPAEALHLVRAIGIRTYSLAEADSSADAPAGTPGDTGDAGLTRLAAAGFDLAELSFNYPAAGVAHDDRATAEKLRRQAARLGITLVSHAPDTFWLSNPDRAELRRTVRGVEAVLEGARAYGARAMVIHACPGKPLLPGREKAQFESLVYALEALAPRCERAGVRLAVETMVPGRLTSSVRTLIEAVDRVDSAWVGICLDTNHVNLSHDLNAAVRRIGPRIIEFHLNDNHFVKEEHLLPYEGAIDWPGLARAVVESGCSSYMVMEPGDHYDGPAEVLSRARAAATRWKNDLRAAAGAAAQRTGR